MAAETGSHPQARARHCRQRCFAFRLRILIIQDGLQDPQCPCEEVHKGSGEAMPEDWAQESALISDCTEDVLRGCVTVTPGYARMLTCLQ